MTPCLICRRAPAEVSWPTRNSPHCRACVKTAREFIAESESRIPKFGAYADELARYCRDALDVGRQP